MSLPIPLSSPDIGPDERALVMQVLNSPTLSIGPMIGTFERELAERLGARAAVAVSSGTAGLHLALIAAGVESGDSVVTSPFSFIASSNAILYQNAKPLFVDIDPRTFAMDVDRTVDAIRSGRVKAVLPVHLFGKAMELTPILDAAREAGIAVIEDACESIGATDASGVPVGRRGDAGVFAFYPNKQMTTGEGGVIVTDRPDWEILFRSLRNHGRNITGDPFVHERLGYNYRLDEMSAAVGIAQLRRLNELLAKRARVAAMYQSRLEGVEGVTPLSGERMSWFVYIIRLADDVDRERLMARLEEQGVPTRPYFPAIHLQPFMRLRFGYKPGDFPHAEEAARSLLALPFHGNLSENEVAYVCDALASELVTSRAASARNPRVV
jgi:perosamine synthetase